MEYYNESENRMTRFTGWANIPMSDTGKLQAAAAGRCLNKLGMTRYLSASVLDRSIDTFEKLVEEIRHKSLFQLYTHGG